MIRTFIVSIGLFFVVWETQAQTAPEIMSRAAWKAKPALQSIAMKPQKPKFITIHHTGVKQNKKRNVEYKMRSLQNFSQSNTKLASGKAKPQWADVPYHFYIGHSGRIAQGRDINFAGDTNTRYDTRNHIQIVVEGNFEIETPAPEQLASLTTLTRWLARKWNVTPDKIGAHADHASTACPGKHLLGHVRAITQKPN